MKYIYTILFFFGIQLYAQQNYTRLWEDLYSFSNVLDMVDNGNEKIYALTENAMFIHDVATGTNQKITTINGLSADIKVKLIYDQQRNQVLVASQNGLIEVYDKNAQIIPLTGIRDNLIFTDKQINHLYIDNNDLYISGNFGIAVLDLNTLEFKGFYKLSNTTFSIAIQSCTINNNILYAASKDGLYYIDLSDKSKNPYDYSDWTLGSIGNIKCLMTVDNKVYYTIDKFLYDSTTDLVVFTTTNTISNLTKHNHQLVITTPTKVQVFDALTNTESYAVTTSSITSKSVNSFQKSFVLNEVLYLATNNQAILKTSTNDLANFSQILVDGPKESSPFKIKVYNGNVIICYGGYDDGMQWKTIKKGVDVYFFNKWYYIPYVESKLGRSDVVSVNFSKNNLTRLYMSSFNYGGNFSGVYIYNYNSTTDNWDYTKKWDFVTTNTTDNKNGLGERVDTPRAQTSEIFIDKDDNVWVANNTTKYQEIVSKFNIETDTWIKRINYSTDFFGADIRIKSLTDDEQGNMFAVTIQPTQGLLIFNKDTDEKINQTFDKLGENISYSGLNKVVSYDKKLWIATKTGLYFLNDYENLYSSNLKKAERIVFEENGEAKELLADVVVNDIEVDGVGNKWFATSAGVVHTSPNGQKTFAFYNTSNSPLPNNEVTDIEIDEVTSKVYMVTSNGIVVLNSGIVQYGSKVSEVIAYPNPCIGNHTGHENITIVTKNNQGLPKGTNIKILDVSGKLVYETNITETQQFYGGKVVWDKKNLQGKKVVPGVYVVLVSSTDGTQTTSTKIAIVN